MRSHCCANGRVEFESGCLVCIWIGLEAEGVPASSGGWETIVDVEYVWMKNGGG